ncbi:hypothetical protein [uncultured Cardiobacterium sp.]|uniref:immunoglobulin-like domain-containing protein n=1 Tax=uncultured Cardiobacterium sp. TaxID=417619 RepID=UPI002611D226|nr:hypothetical protein [uncultured Cardiobacterium sp.]
MITISGEAKVGSELTAAISDSDGVPTSGVTYQWLRDGVAISGETNNTYTLTRDDAGHKITVRATYKDNAGHDETPLSETKDIPAEGNHAPTDISLSGNSLMEGKDGAEVGKLTTTDEDAGDTHTYTVSDSRFEVADGTLKLKAGQHLDFAQEPQVNLSVTTDDGHGGTYSKAFTLHVQDDPAYPVQPQGTPVLGLQGVSVVKEGEAAQYQLLLNHPADQDVTVEVEIASSNTKHGVQNETRTLTIPKGESSLTFAVDTTHNGVEDNGSNFQVRIKHAEGASLNTAAPSDLTHGSGGEDVFGASNTYSAAGLSGEYRLFPAGAKLVLYLHGEATNDYGHNASIFAEYVADRGDATVLMVKTPDSASGSWSVNGEQNARYLRALLEEIYSKYDIDKGDVLLLGNGGGADFITRYLLPEHNDLFSGGTALMIGGGAADPTLHFGKTPADGLKQHLQLKWIAGSADGDTVVAAQHAQEQYAQAGFHTQRETIPDGDRMTAVGHIYEAFYDEVNNKNAGSMEMTTRVSDIDAVNHAPTNIRLYHTTIAEGKDGAEIGGLSTNDPDWQDKHSYTVSDERFEISADGTLKLKAGQHIDYADEQSVTLTITTTDNGGLSFSKTFTLQVEDNPLYPSTENHAPTDIKLDQGLPTINGEQQYYINEGKDGFSIGTVQTVDPDPRDSHRYTLSDERFEITADGILKLKDGMHIDYATEQSISLTIIATDPGGLSVEKTFTLRVNDDPHYPNREGSVTISGEAKVGGELTANVSDPDTVSDSSIRYQWLIDGVAVAGATQKTYTLRPEDVGKKVSVHVEYRDNGLHDEAHDSDGLDVAAPAENRPGSVRIGGEAKVGGTLTATVTDADEFAADKVQYQWLRDGVAIKDANGKTYQLTADDAGHKITVQATYKDNAGHDENPTSDAADIPAPPANHAGTVAIMGETKVGGTLTATVSDADNFTADQVQYQWLRDGVAIDKATGNTYQLTNDDAGHKITVQATYKDNAGHDENPTSEPATVADNGNAPLMQDDFSAYPLHKTYTDNDTFGAWKVAFAGYGNAEIIDNGGGNQALQLRPMAHSGQTETSSTMVVSTVQTGNNFTYSGTISTPEQLRQDAAPNPWETAWLVWNHSDNDHYYYFVARANGWELGKRDPAYSGGQRFMATGSESWPLAEAKHFVVAKSGNTVEISINGKVITTFTDDDNPYTGGSIGLYTEDARIVADDISLTANAGITGTANHGGVASISGKAATGEVLHAAVSDGDGAVSNVSYQWMAAGKEIGGATGETYTVTADNSGKNITVRITYTDHTGKVESVISPPTAVVDSGNDGGANQKGSVILSGTAAVGETLSAAVSDADGVPDRVQYTWLANGAAISGANGSSYTVTAADVGKVISVQVYYYDKAGHEENFVSSPTAAVTDAAPQPNHAPTGSVTISGEAMVGKTLTAANDLADEDGLGTISYHWLADGKEIATGASYTLTEAEQGKGITVKATYTDGKGTAEAVESSATAAVADAPAPQTPPVATLSGAAGVNEGEAAEYTVTLDKASDHPVTLTLTLSHGETTDGDLGSISKTLIIPAGETSAKVSLQTTADGIPENTEHYTLSISEAEGATIGADKAVTTAISDNDEKAAYHTGSVADSTFAGDRSANDYYFINSLDSTQRATYGHYYGHKPGDGLRITYAFSADGVENGKVMDGFRPYSAQQKADIRTVLDHLEEHVNLKFTEGSNATLNFYLQGLEEGVSGYGIYGGNVHLSTRYYAADDAFAKEPPYTVNTVTHELTLKHGWGTALHEIGHSLGMEHPFGHDDSSLNINSAEDRNDLTVMSYTTGQYDYDVDLGQGWSSPKVPLSPIKLGIYDLAALHHAYGVNPDYHSGDDTYGFKPFNKDAVGNDIYIHDGGGQDIFDASEQTLDLNIDLTPGSWLYAGTKAEHLALDDSGNPTMGQMFIGYGTQIESAKGGTGNDTIKGNSAANYLFGFDGDDNIDGGAGNDQIEGGRGSDTLKGGAGADTFIFRSPFDGTIDTLLDFNAAAGDRIQLDHNIFTGLQKGSLSAEQFVQGTEAKDADDRIIYNRATGELAYDADGNGDGAAVTIARLGINTELDNNHIQII